LKIKIFWCNEKYKNNIIALTIEGSVYKSTDDGFKWTKIKNELIDSMDMEGFKNEGNV